MKKLFLFLFIVILDLVSLYGQNGWSADLRVYHENYQVNDPNKEMNINMIVDLYYNNILQSVLPSTKYEFFEKIHFIA